MDKTHLFYQIAETIRQDIRNEVLHPGDRLPSVREMAARWNCTIGTIQRAYEELADQGLVTSRPGQGTHCHLGGFGYSGDAPAAGCSCPSG